MLIVEVGRGRNDRLVAFPKVKDGRIFAKHDDKHLMRKHRQERGLGRVVRTQGTGANEFDVERSGVGGQEGRPAQPHRLTLRKPRVAAEDDRSGHVPEQDRRGPQAPLVVEQVRLHLLRERDPVILLHEGQDVERGDLRPVEFKRRTLLAIGLLGPSVGVGQLPELPGRLALDRFKVLGQAEVLRDRGRREAHRTDSDDHQELPDLRDRRDHGRTSVRRGFR